LRRPRRAGKLRRIDERALRDETTQLLRELIRVDTSNPPGRETPAAVLLRGYLEASGVECELVARTPERANLIARIRGSGGGPSLALLGHTDVVPAHAPDWRHPPFSGHLDEEGFVWGRGALDMKGETASRAVAIAVLARSGFRPHGDLVFVAEADEEDGTEQVGLVWLVRERPDIRTDFALNEGGGERYELADGRVVVTLEVGEKATLPALVTALGEAGHASTPWAGANAVPRLATLIERLAAYRPARRLLPQTRTMLEALEGPLDGDLDAAIERTSRLHESFGETVPALFGTTIAPTRLRGSDARNVMPGRASVECDCRVLPGTTEDELRAELHDALGEGIPYEIEFLEPPTGGSVTPLATPLFEVCRRFVEEHDPGAIVLPTISTGFTDSHFLREAFGTAAYGFWPSRHTPHAITRSTVHNRDERIHVDDLGYGTLFTVEACRAIGGL
jgi:acetylornithine deacetylase/succinyl-diaminopimelate desuccinylase-like protein